MTRAPERSAGPKLQGFVRPNRPTGAAAISRPEVPGLISHLRSSKITIAAHGLRTYIHTFEVDRRCQRSPVPTLPAVFKLLGCVFLSLRTIVRRWHGHWQCYHPAVGPSTSALKLLRCTFTSLRMVLRRCWSRDLFALHSDLLYPSEFAPLNFIVGTSRFASKNILRNANVPEFLKHRYARVRYTVKFKCVLASMLSIVHSWWDNHLLPHPTDRPHLFDGKYTAEYLMGVSRDFDARNEAMHPK